jgi:hypothetical protein
VIGQWFALWLSFGFGFNASRVVTLARGCDLGFLKGQFKLVDDVIQRFRLCTKPMPAQIGQLQLEFSISRSRAWSSADCLAICASR